MLAAGHNVDVEKERETLLGSSGAIIVSMDPVRPDREHFQQWFNEIEGLATLPLGPAKEFDRTLAGHAKALDFDIT
ncbi:hypothetical protein MVEG_10601 [Podila verticillata NRRL 6337]|nr:hypothetical protein MVEG_10601 [Podila verticillata NRRL 6337]